MIKVASPDTLTTPLGRRSFLGAAALAGAATAASLPRTARAEEEVDLDDGVFTYAKPVASSSTPWTPTPPTPTSLPARPPSTRPTASRERRAGSSTAAWASF